MDIEVEEKLNVKEAASVQKDAGWVHKIKFILKFISLGQYPTKLYHDGRDAYSTIYGGLVTIICLLILLGYGSYLIYSLSTYDIEYFE